MFQHFLFDNNHVDIQGETLETLNAKHRISIFNQSKTETFPTSFHI